MKPEFPIKFWYDTYSRRANFQVPVICQNIVAAGVLHSRTQSCTITRARINGGPDREWRCGGMTYRRLKHDLHYPLSLLLKKPCLFPTWRLLCDLVLPFLRGCWGSKDHDRYLMCCGCLRRTRELDASHCISCNPRWRTKTRDSKRWLVAGSDKGLLLTHSSISERLIDVTSTPRTPTQGGLIEPRIRIHMFT